MVTDCCFRAPVEAECPGRGGVAEQSHTLCAKEAEGKKGAKALIFPSKVCPSDLFASDPSS